MCRKDFNDFRPPSIARILFSMVGTSDIMEMGWLEITLFTVFASKLGNKLVKNRLSGAKYEEDVKDSKWAHQNKKNYSKNDICKIFNWDVNKPIVLVFSHSLIDGNRSCGSRVFKDNLTWLRETLLGIKNIDKFNWMIKPHPMDWYYEFSKTTTENEYKKIADDLYQYYKSISLENNISYQIVSPKKMIFSYLNDKNNNSRLINGWRRELVDIDKISNITAPFFSVNH